MAMLSLYRRFRRLQCVPLLLTVLAITPGCELKTTVQGVVFDVKGEQLPGVAVTLRGTEVEDITGGTGGYALRCPPGPAVLDFIKTGYTRGRLDLTVPDSGEVEATEVRLWPVPAGQGVYLYENFRYRETTRIEPQPFRMPERGPVLASKVPPGLQTFNAQPLIIYTLLPAYDAALYRMAAVTAAHPQAEIEATGGEPVWIVDSPVTSVIVPIDEPDRQLLELRPTEPLTPGTYAVSWGAFDGYTSTHASAYLFEVVDPNAPDEAPEVVPPTAESPQPDSKAAPASEPEPNSEPDPVPATELDSDDSGGIEG
jgi:hypothetical protein